LRRRRRSRFSGFRRSWRGAVFGPRRAFLAAAILKRHAGN
jgi:hypothetical protein